jgi:acyl dehydratase
VKEVTAIRRGMSMAVNYGLNRVRFPSPVRSESMIRAYMLVDGSVAAPDASRVPRPSHRNESIQNKLSAAR